MIRKILPRILCLLITAVLSVTAAAPLEYSRTDASEWMAGLDDEAPLNTLSIPGTHDSGAVHSIGDVAGKCQSLTIAEQLKTGVRFFDIRLRQNGDAFDIVHSFVDQGVDFDEVLADLADFIRTYPTEFLLVSVKEDADPVSPEGDFSALFENLLAEHSDIISTAGTLPDTVADARGKIHLISRCGKLSFGIPAYSGWADSASFVLGDFYVQDNYCVDNSDVKMADIMKTMEESASLEYALTLNFTSCYFTSGFPPTYAAFPAKEINPRLCEMIPEGEGALGVMICDFMTSSLAQAIIERNERSAS